MKKTILFILMVAGLGLVINQGAALAENLPDPAPAIVPEGDKLDVRKGLKVYKAACAACHATGKSGAPRLHDAAAWKDRAFQSFSVMEKHAKEGFLRMPPKGKRPILTDREMADAVFYMTEQIKDKAGR